MLIIVMFLWLAIFVATIVAFIIQLINRQVSKNEEQAPTKSFFDFSVGRQEDLQLKGFLSKALAESKTDSDFEDNFKKLIVINSGLDVELAWAWLNRSLMEYRQAGEFDNDSRLLAMRFLQDIEHRYKLNGD